MTEINSGATGSSLAGAILDHYRLIAPIGSGGMGVVYKAEDLLLGRLVAIKLIARDKENAPARLRREALAASALSHPNICTIYGLGQACHESFIVMELLEGQALRTALTGAPMPIARVVEIALGVVDALAAAHARDIIHRDIKPSNIFLTSSGQVKVLDFGIAKLSSPANTLDGSTASGIGLETLTDTGGTVGTVAYMSPEQTRGEALDPRTDIFSLGVVLYQLASGRPPFTGPTSGVIAEAILNRNPEPPSRLNPSVRPALEAIILKALAKDRRHRYQSVAEVRNELVTMAQGPRLRSQGDVDRRIIVSATAAAVLVLMTIFAATWTGRASHSGETVNDSSNMVVAVLPFRDLSRDSPQPYLANGWTEEIRDQLSKLPTSRLLSRSATEHYRDRDVVPLREDLAATGVVEGSVRVEGDRVRVSVQWIDTRTERTIWSEQFDRTQENALIVEADVALKIADALKINLSADERRRLTVQPTRSVEAFELYVSTQSLRQADPAQNAEAVALLRRALQIDPGFSLAEARLAYFLLWRSLYDGHSYRTQSVELARRALALDPTLAYTHFVLASALGLDGLATDARLEFLKALELNPSDVASMQNLSEVESLTLGRLDEGLYWARRAAQLQPNHWLTYFHVAEPLIFLRDDRVTERWLDEGRRRFPNVPRIQLVSAMYEYLRGDEAAALNRVRQAVSALPPQQELTMLLAELSYLTGAPDSLSQLKVYAERAPDVTARYILKPETFRTAYAYILKQRGDTTRATKLLDDALLSAQNALTQHNEWSRIPLEIAAIHAARGDPDNALKWVTRGYASGYRDYETISRDPIFASLRTRQQFEELCRRMKADVAAMRVRSRDLPELASLLNLNSSSTDPGSIGQKDRR